MKRYPNSMKVVIDGVPNEFIRIFWVGDHFQCNTSGNRSAHGFTVNPKDLPKDKEVKANGHIYVFPSK